MLTAPGPGLQHFCGPFLASMDWRRRRRSTILVTEQMPKRANNLMLSLAAILSLFVSAVSACACSHHQVKAKADEPSCHSSGHAAPAAESPGPATGESLDAGCGCFINAPVPAITAKSESKKPHSGKLAVTAVPANDVLGTFSDLRIQVSSPQTELAAYGGRRLTSGPPRAPPRL